MKKIIFLCVLVCNLSASWCQSGSSAYPDWAHHSDVYINTGSDGAYLPAEAQVKDFPILIRLNSDFFDFGQASPEGADLRFTSAEGEPLSYQIEEWNVEKGRASIWVRIPLIKGNSKQKIVIYWGKQGAKSESDGKQVFNSTNGYLSVFHLNDPLKDACGVVKCLDQGSKASEGIIGPGRRFENGSHISGGDNITSYPSGNEERTTSAWIKADKEGWAVDWGMEARCQENSIKLEKPLVIKNEGYLCDVWGETELDLGQWHHAAITYKDGILKAFVNGKEDGYSEREFSTPETSYLRIGKRHNSQDNRWGRQWWNGELDEIRISGKARSPEWIYLEYENQKPLQRLVGQPLIPGDYMAVSDREIFLNEGDSITVKGEAGGSGKVYWISKSKKGEKIVAVDQLSLNVSPGRIKGDQTSELIFRALYPEGFRDIVIPVIFYEDIPDPDFIINAPVGWDGREDIEITSSITNMDQLRDRSADKLNYKWSVSNIAALKETRGDTLILKKAMNSGMLLVTLEVDNGGKPLVKTIGIKVEEPVMDEWEPLTEENVVSPKDNMFIARNDNGFGTIHYKGRIKTFADSIVLRIYADDKLYKESKQAPGKKRSFYFKEEIEAGMVQYDLELWAQKPRENKLIEKIENVICGDVYIINGQSNAEAYDNGKAVNTYSSKWVRSFGSSSPDPEKSLINSWGNAVSFDKEKSEHQIGYWGIELAKNIVAKHRMPVCIINGAVGGSRIDEHQKDHENPLDESTIYGRLLRRVKAAGLTHGVRGVIWHQGENNQGAAGPDPGYDWQHYEKYFIELAADWNEDYPNIQNLFMFQIWPDACSMGRNGSGDMLREAQRKLPHYFSNLRIMSTLGIRPGGGCHFPPEGYKKMADLIMPLIEEDIYNVNYDKPVSPPDLLKAYFTNERRDEIALEFDQPMDWDIKLINQFYLDGQDDLVRSGSLHGNVIKLKLKSRSEAAAISYLDGKNWDEENILYGRNGLAALTFCKVPLMSLDAAGIRKESLLERSPLSQQYQYLSKGGFTGDNIMESPDPLISYVWPDPSAEDDLEIFTLKPVYVDTDNEDSFDDLHSLLSDKPMVKVKGEGSIRIDFGLEMPAWIEFDSPDCSSDIEMSISEYNQPGRDKTKAPVKYGSTYRLELNEELYDGVRFAWIHVNSHNTDWHITGIRAVNQAKPANYLGSFSCSDQMLTRVWYTSAYSVRAALCEDYFGAILMDRGDRMSWTGDAHPSQAAALVAFANYDFIRKNIENTADQNNGIRSYSLYWVLSLLDYFKYSGDRETLDKYLNNAANKLDDAYIEFGSDPNLRFYGWDERLTAGFELWFMEAPEAQLAYKMLTIRVWMEFAELMKKIGRNDLESKYSWWARRKIAELRDGRDWIKQYGIHSATEAINTGLLNQREIDSVYINKLVNRSDRLSLSPFNQYFILQALAKINRHDDAISTIKDLWGGMIKNGATTTYEVFRPSWNDFLEPNDPVPNSQSGIVSLCHPWGAGPVKWINEEILGIKPLEPGFKSYDISPNPGKRLEWIKGTTPTPFGPLKMSLDLIEGTMNVESPQGTTGRIGIPRSEKLISKVFVNDQLVWDGNSYGFNGISGLSFDDKYIYLEAVQPGEYNIRFEYTGSSSFYVEPHFQYTSRFVGIDSLTSGNWGSVFGSEGFALTNYYGQGSDKLSLPAYVDSISYFRAFPRSDNNKPDAVVWDSNTSDERALASGSDNDPDRTASALTSTGETMTATVHMNREQNYQIAFYFLDWEDLGSSQAIEIFDAKTLNLISPVKMVSSFNKGKYLIFNYNNSIKIRINKIRGGKIYLNGIFFDPIK